MSGSVPRKHKKKDKQRLAARIYKSSTSTSTWTEAEAVQYFNMDKQAVSVLRAGLNDTMPPLEWYVNKQREVFSRELGDEG